MQNDYIITWGGRVKCNRVNCSNVQESTCVQRWTLTLAATTSRLSRIFSTGRSAVSVKDNFSKHLTQISTIKIVYNIARIVKATLHKLPGKSSLNVSFVCPVCPVCLKLEVVWSHITSNLLSTASMRGNEIQKAIQGKTVFIKLFFNFWSNRNDSFGPQNGLKGPKWAILWPKPLLVAPIWWSSVERDCNKSWHIRADALEPFHGSDVSIGGAIGPLNGLKGPKWAILWP